MADYSTTLICDSCKKYNPSDVKNCQVCGAPLPVQRTNVPTTAPKQPGKVWAGCVGIFVVLTIIGIIGMIFGLDEMSESWKAGYQVGLLEGNVAYNSGARRSSDDDLDAAARRITARVSFDSPEKRDEWIRGYKAGYGAGWNKK
jgi:hypothetical protein